MASPPSSPPLEETNHALTVALPKLPKLPSTEFNGPPSTTQQLGFYVHQPATLDEIFATSSDPPLFSSDDLPTSSADNYHQRRRKRQYQRSWYEPEDPSKRIYLRGSGKKRHIEPRSLRRQYDSGIFMDDPDSSDHEVEQWICEQLVETPGLQDISNDTATIPPTESKSETSDSYVPFSHPDIMSRETASHHNTHARSGRTALRYDEEKRQNERWKSLTAQERASNVVANAIDQGSEDVYLSHLDIDDLPAPILQPLRYLTKACPAEQGIYSSFVPTLKLSLANNRLKAIPTEVYRLPDLQVLSVRGNEVTELLPAIANLRQLHELNLGSNRLRYLPYEVLKLWQEQPACDTPRFSFFPNPFIRPSPSGCTGWFRSIQDNPDEYREQLHKDVPHSPLPSGSISHHDPSLVASTPVTFLDTAGRRPLLDCPPAPSSRATHWVKPCNHDHNERTSEGFSRNGVPSLLELCLRSAYTAPNLEEAPQMLAPHASSDLLQLLDRAIILKQSSPAVDYPISDQFDTDPAPTQPGSRAPTAQSCTICSKPFLIPRTEWLEWHNLSDPTIDSSTSFIASEPPLMGFLRVLNRAQSITPGPVGSDTRELSASIPLVPFLRRGCSWRCYKSYDESLVRGWRPAVGDEDGEVSGFRDADAELA